jgi:hypothetical protein
MHTSEVVPLYAIKTYMQCMDIGYMDVGCQLQAPATLSPYEFSRGSVPAPEPV